MAETSSKEVVRELAALMKAHGVTRCVLCPGSRNAPICATLAADVDFECRNVTDERSAGFVALGWAAQSQAPVAVCVTSGSAVLNLHPAVAEASYRNIPIFVISADRPAEWIGQQDGQTIPQPDVFGKLNRMSAALPEYDPEGWYTNRLINEALLELTHRGGGPVHINVPLCEPLFQTTAEPLPMPRVIRRTELAKMTADEEQELLEITAVLPRRLIVMGQMDKAPYFPPELMEDHGFALVGEHLSNCDVADCSRPDTLIGPDDNFPDIPSPDLLITMGGDIISKRLKRMLRKNPPTEHWHLSADGEVCDTFCCLTRVIEGDMSELLELLGAFAEEGDESYRRLWLTQPAEFKAPHCGMSMVGDLMAALPSPSVLHLGNSSAVRYSRLFPLPKGVQVECNRGVNGIEGSLSTALGYAAGDARPQFLIIGDLSFFYDMNALWMNGISANVRILLLNNGCGGIFSTIGTPSLDCVSAPHNATAEAWSISRGFEYRSVCNAEEWPDALDTLLHHSESPVLVEAFTDSKQDAEIIRKFYREH